MFTFIHHNNNNYADADYVKYSNNKEIEILYEFFRSKNLDWQQIKEFTQISETMKIFVYSAYLDFYKYLTLYISSLFSNVIDIFLVSLEINTF
jgi:hypothetical protein